MDINNAFYIEVLEQLNDSSVKYVLIGGLAVNYHGYARYTGDMDLWINPEVSNMKRLYSALIDLGYPDAIVKEIEGKRGLEDPTPIRLRDDSDTVKIDLMTNTFQKEFSWEECYSHSNLIDLDRVQIPVVHINHLIQMKENTKRLDSSMKDLVDAQELKNIKELKSKNSKEL